jgi:hypothetical protein
MVKFSDTAKNSKIWRDKKKAEGYCFENFMVRAKTLKAVEKIAKDFGCDKHTAVDKVVEKFVNSADYQREITMEKLEDFQERIGEFNRDLKSFKRAYFINNYTADQIEKMKELLKGKSLRNQLNYGKLEKNNPDIMKLKSYDEYKLFVKAFDLSNSDEED